MTFFALVNQILVIFLSLVVSDHPVVPPLHATWAVFKTGDVLLFDWLSVQGFSVHRLIPNILKSIIPIQSISSWIIMNQPGFSSQNAHLALARTLRLWCSRLSLSRSLRKEDDYRDEFFSFLKIWEHLSTWGVYMYNIYMYIYVNYYYYYALSMWLYMLYKHCWHVCNIHLYYCIVHFVFGDQTPLRLVPLWTSTSLLRMRFIGISVRIFAWRIWTLPCNNKTSLDGLSPLVCYNSYNWINSTPAKITTTYSVGSPSRELHQQCSKQYRNYSNQY